MLADAERLDVAVYVAIAKTPTPTLDRAMSLLSRAADHSKISLASAGAFALSGRSGRNAALGGLTSLGVTSAVVNLAVKRLWRRRRPDRAAHAVPTERHIPMPSSRSFPSGHSASAFAFAAGVSESLPAAGVPLRAIATLVAYSRVHTGVHYPADVVAGALMGTTLAEVTTHAIAGRGFMR